MRTKPISKEFKPLPWVVDLPWTYDALVARLDSVSGLGTIAHHIGKDTYLVVMGWGVKVHHKADLVCMISRSNQVFVYPGGRTPEGIAIINSILAVRGIPARVYVSSEGFVLAGRSRALAIKTWASVEKLSTGIHFWQGSDPTTGVAGWFTDPLPFDCEDAS